MPFNTKICQDLSEEAIIRKTQSDTDYFACLVMRYENRLLTYIRKIAQISQQEAEDILQESFIKVWKNLFSFHSSMKLENWIFRIVHNETISFMRKKTSFGKNNTIEIKDDIMTVNEEEKNSSEPENINAMIEHVLPLLKLDYRNILVLKYLEDKSYEEISDILKIPEGTVAIRLHRAKKAFKKLAENTFDHSILNDLSYE
jgi:RNA polymerase sigma-70 factor (ECF subfamily)